MPWLWGAVAGALGGIAATLAMNKAQRRWTLAADGRPPMSAAGERDARDWQERDEGQNSNELAAQCLAALFLDRPLTTSELARPTSCSDWLPNGPGARSGARFLTLNGHG